MAVTRKKIRTDYEKDILTGMVVNEDFMREMELILKETYFYFKAPHIKTVISWVLLYWEEYGKVPMASVMDIFNSKSETLLRDDDVDIIEELLEDISEKYEQLDDYDAQYQIKRATIYCKKMSVLNLASEVKGLAESGDVAKAESQVGQYKRVDNRISEGLDPSNASKERAAIYSSDNSLTVIRFPGVFGRLIGNIERGGLYLIAAASKRGKTFTMLDMIRMCRMAGLNSSVYTLEMKKQKLQIRWDMNLSKSLVFVNDDDTDMYDDEYPGTSQYIKYDPEVTIPHFDTDNSIVYKKSRATPITEKKGNRAERLFNRQYPKGQTKIFDIVTTGNTLASIIQNELNEERYNGFVSDIVFIDSIYLLADQHGDSDHTRLANIHWRAKQELGEKLNKAVVSPYQHNKEALKTNADEGNLAGSYAVYSHCSAVLHLNATTSEMERGLIRMSAGGRDGNYHGEVLVTRGLDIGRGIMDSRWLKDVPNYEEIVNGEIATEEDEAEMKEMSLKDVQ